MKFFSFVLSRQDLASPRTSFLTLVVRRSPSYWDFSDSAFRLARKRSGLVLLRCFIFGEVRKIENSDCNEELLSGALCVYVHCGARKSSRVIRQLSQKKLRSQKNSVQNNGPYYYNGTSNSRFPVYFIRSWNLQPTISGTSSLIYLYRTRLRDEESVTKSG